MSGGNGGEELNPEREAEKHDEEENGTVTTLLACVQPWISR